MTVLELALIDIRHFKEVKKLTLKPGFNLIQGGNGSGKTTLFTIFYDLLFPSYENYPQNRSSQAAILFKLNNGDVYRLLRHFSKQSAQLYKLDATKKFVLLEKDDQKIQETLLLLLNIGHLSKEQVFSFFFLNRTDLPSLSSGSSARILTVAPIPSSKNSPDSGKIKDRLEELRKQEVQADRIAQKESEMLDQKDRVFSIKRILNELGEIESEISGLLEKEKVLPGFDAIPKDIERVMEDYEKALQEKESEEQQLIEEKEIIEQQLALEQQNLIQNKFLWGGASMVLIALFLPFFIDLEGLSKQLDLFGLLIGIGLALFALIGDFNKISRRKVWKVKLENKNKNLEMLNARFQREHSKYFEVLKRTESPDRETFETKLSAYRHLREEEQTFLQKKQDALSEKTKEELIAELNAASEKGEALEREINQLKPGTADPYVIQQEIKTLEESLGSGHSLSAPDQLSVSGATGFETQIFDSSSSLLSFFERDWSILLKISNLNHEQISTLAQKRVSSLAGGSLSIQINEQGRISLNKDLGTLSPGTLDQLFLSLFTQRLELLQNIPLPFLLDDPLITLDPEHQTIFLNSLKELAKKREIIFFSNAPYPVENANLVKL